MNIKTETQNSKWSSRQAVLSGLLLIYLLFQLFLLFRHEPWRDEANVWLMGRELSPIQLFAEIKYQGHPCLWYLLVMPLAKLGLPFRSIGVLSLLIMTVSAALFLWKATLSLPVKAICLLSTAFTYFYPVIARNYCLIPLFLMLLAWIYPKRNDKSILYGLLLGALVQTDTIAIAAAGLISCMWLWENGFRSIREKSGRALVQCLKGIWIPLASLLLWLLQFYRVSDSPAYQIHFESKRELARQVGRYAFVIMQRMTGWHTVVIVLFWVLFLAASAALAVKLRNGWAPIVMIVSFLIYALFSALIYELHIFHFLSLFFVWIWMVWVTELQCREKQISGASAVAARLVLEGLLAVLSVGMFLHWNSAGEPSDLKHAVNGLYSDGGQAAAYIRDNIAKEELIVSTNVPMASTVLAYLDGYTFYYAGSGKKTSYADWTAEQERTIAFPALKDWVRENFPEKEAFYLILTQESCLEEAEALQECQRLYRTKEETVRGEEYSVYRIPVR